jgi:hypothetical protein
MWLTGRLAPDFKTIADFRRDSGAGIRSVCRRFIVLCRELTLFSQSIVAVGSSKFKAVNNRDRNFTAVKIDRFLTFLLAQTGPKSEAFGLLVASLANIKNSAPLAAVNFRLCCAG